MKAKSIMTLNTAQRLINTKDNGCLTASVHCSYYAVLQRMKYILSVTEHAPGPVSLREQDEKCSVNSHEYLLEEIKKRIKSNPRKERNFSEIFRDLKAKRINADYRSKVYTIDESLDCKSKAESLLSNLNTFFGEL